MIQSAARGGLFRAVVPAVLAILCLAGGCNAIRNGWLDPTVLGSFDTTSSMQIRTSLTLEDTSPGIVGATFPMASDLQPQSREYPITSGDTLVVEINELRDRNIPFQAQVQVSSTGRVNMPVVGTVMAEGLTLPQFEEAIGNALKDRNILLDPDVTVNPLFLHAATYSIFGIGVSASNTAPLRAGTFPIRRSDLRILEAINQVGGLNEFVTEIYVFRYDDKPEAAPSASPAPNTETQDDSFQPLPEEMSGTSAERELLEAAMDPGSDAGEEPAVEELPSDLLPDPTQPYLFVQGEFVPNPAYQGEGAEPSAAVAAPTFDVGAPTVNWARIAGDSNFRIIRIPAEPLRSGDPEVNIFVRGGDVIRVVSGEIGVYYVMGQVVRVGPYRFAAEQITLKAAIASAGGLSGLAWPERCTVYRRLGMREQMIQVNLDRIFAGKDADFMIKRGDIINVGTHPFAPFLQRLRAWTLPTPANTLGYSFTYSRNFADIDSFAVQQNPANKPEQFPQLFP